MVAGLAARGGADEKRPGGCPAFMV